MLLDLERQLGRVADELDRLSPPLSAAQIASPTDADLVVMPLAPDAPTRRRKWWLVAAAAAAIVAGGAGIVAVRSSHGTPTSAQYEQPTSSDFAPEAPAEASPARPASAAEDALAPGAQFFPAECLAGSADAALASHLVPTKIDGASDPAAVTGLKIGDPVPTEPSSADTNREVVVGESASPEWTSVGAGTPPVVIGYVWGPNDGLPAKGTLNNCHPEVAIYDGSGVLIGAFVNSLPEVAS